MFKRLGSFSHHLGRKSKSALHHKLTRSFFWSKKTKNDNAQQSDDDELANLKNLSYLVQKIKEENKQKPPLLPPRDLKFNNKLTVLVEMDEVLLHAFAPSEEETYMNAPQRDYDALLHFKKYDTYLSIYLREHLDEFLNYLKENTEPVLYCTGEKDYIELVMDKIDPGSKIFQHRIYQEGCSRIEYQEEQVYDFVKDLDWVGRDLKRTVLLDAKPFCFWPNPNNGIPVIEYYADSGEKDEELRNLIEQLEELKEVEDVRTRLAEKFSIQMALEESKML
mmetsp:Transcript_4520/g.4994  ORF Transcript_4520/g.4994 Transcript_4520/m.4994 type:complete len:278 (-) Transcript_4520:209-1042(-)